jgi:methionine synthase I (cobalamin-dependent)
VAARLEDFTGKVTVADGAWGTELDKLGCSPGFCREEWNVTRPELIRQVADAYIEAGAAILLTNTFGANRYVLGRHERGDKVEAFNYEGARVAREAAGQRAHVFGDIGPSGKIIMMDEVDRDELFEAFKAQANALAEGGADGLVIETMTELAEAVIAVRAARSTGLLVAACMTFDSGRTQTDTMMGVTPQQAVEALSEAGADIIGCNCGIGIEPYVKVTEMFRAATDKPLWVKANAGLPEIEGGKVVYKMQPGEYAAQVRELVRAGANIVGGCCGTSPAFIQAIKHALAR